MSHPRPDLPATSVGPAALAPEPEPLLERPGGRPAGPRRLLRDLGLSYVSNGAIGLIFAASGPIAVTLAVGTAGGLTQGQLSSWVFGILFSGGAATLLMSLIYRQPLGFAWSIPGTVLLGPSLQHLTFPEVVGAFFTSGVLILALGATGVVRKAMALAPMPIVMAMVAAVFLKFGTDIVASTQDNPAVAAPMVAAFLVLTAVPMLGRYLPPVLGTLVAGCIAVAASGQFNLSHGGPLLATPVFTAPEFTWAAQLELVVPLALTVLFVQNGQGIAVLRAAGHHPPVNAFAIASGAFSVLNAGFGAVSACVTGPTNALLTSSGKLGAPIHGRRGVRPAGPGVRSVCPHPDPADAGRAQGVRPGAGWHRDAAGPPASLRHGLRNQLHPGLAGDVRGDHLRHEPLQHPCSLLGPGDWLRCIPAAGAVCAAKGYL
jgi:benzoate membrane transport protein